MCRLSGQCRAIPFVAPASGALPAVVGVDRRWSACRGEQLKSQIQSVLVKYGEKLQMRLIAHEILTLIEFEGYVRHCRVSVKNLCS